MAEQLRPDLIVLDLAMPVMNGLDAARVLKRIMPTVPLIMFSAFGGRFVEEQARLIGISEVVSKSDPFSVLLAKARYLVYPTRLNGDGSRRNQEFTLIAEQEQISISERTKAGLLSSSRNAGT